MMKKISSLLLLILFLFGSIKISNGEPVKDKWTKISTGITGGVIRSIVQSKQNETLIYCATFGKGVYKSQNNGMLWEPISQGLDNLYILSLAVHPKNDQIILAGTWGFGIYKTIDGGKNWEQSRTGVDHNIINSLTRDGMFKSYDEGKTWNYMPTDFMKSLVEYFTVSPSNPRKFYVGARERGLFYSDDKGSTWKHFPEQEQLNHVHSIAEDPDNDKIVYVGTELSGVYKYKFDDYSETWSGEKFGFANFDVTSIFFNPQNHEEMTVSTYGKGIYHSLDKGKKWSTITTGPGSTDIQFLYQDIYNVPVIWAGTHSMGIWKSPDRGKSWVEKNTNLDGLVMNGIVTDPKDSTMLYAFAYGSVFRSQSKGIEWTRLNKGLLNFDIKSLTIDPSDSEILYATTEGAGAFKSMDRGENWFSINEGLKYNRVFSLAVNPKNSKHLLAGSYGKGVYQSNNGGKSWTLTNNGIEDAYVVSILFHPTEENVILIASYSSGVFKSTDDGIHWVPMNAGLETNFVLTLAMNPENSNILYCGADGYKAFKSVNGGLSWVLMDQGLDQTVSRFFVSKLDYPNVIYCAGIGGIYYSANRGVYWKAMSEGLDKNSGLGIFDANMITIAQDNSFVLYASTYMGLFRYEMTNLPDIDRVAPMIDLDNKQDPMKVKEPYASLKGKVWDEYTGVMRFEINKEQVLLSPEGKFDKNVSLNLGVNFVEFVAIDKAGNINEKVLKVFYDDGVDRIPPKLEIEYPLDESKISQSPVLVKGRVSDEGSGVQVVKVNNFNTMLDKDGFFSYELDLSPGENKITISALDNSGNEAIEKRTVYFIKPDTTPPLIEIFSPEEGVPLPENKVTIIGRVSDPERTIQDFFINNQPTKLDKLGNFTYPIVLEKGENTILLVAFNSDGLKAEKNLKLIYQPKQITIELYIGNSLAFINGKRSILDAPPFIYKGRTVVPLRFIGEAFGALIDWNPTLRSITLDFKKKDIQLVLTIDDKTVYINGKKTTLEVPPMIQKGRTFVPLRFIGEATSCSIDWDAKEQKITLGYSE
jgi:photosystem II stability/assembly factor-like uncharacterized protein